MRSAKITFAALLLFLVQHAAFAVPSVQAAQKQPGVTIAAANVRTTQVLAMVFAQVHQQFVCDGDIGGSITLSLQQQPLPVALKAICSEAYLRYYTDSRGITHFTRDQKALQTAILHIKTSAALLQQMRMLGMPSPAAPHAFMAYTAPPGHFQPLTPWDEQMRLNHLVGFQIPAGQTITVAQALQEFGRQAGIAIDVDPEIALDTHFRLNGHLVRPLPQALALLAGVAHLDYFIVGSHYYVTTAPDFHIFYGASTQPRVSYPEGSQAKP